MGTPGVKFQITKDMIVSVIKECKGVIAHSAKKLDISELWLRREIKKFPDVVELLAELRHNFNENILDMAENTMQYAMSKREEDLSSALRGAMYTLNSRGQSRGWNNTLVINDKTPSEYDMQNKNMEIAALKSQIEQLTNGISDQSKTESELS